MVKKKEVSERPPQTLYSFDFNRPIEQLRIDVHELLKASAERIYNAEEKATDVTWKRRLQEKRTWIIKALGRYPERQMSLVSSKDVEVYLEAVKQALL